MPHSYDFDELGRYYLQYQSVMDHWRKVLPPGTMIDLEYEDVVADVEGSARRLIEFVGLDWDPACVEFHKSSRPVKTASVAQVRRPVYTGSVERWRKYGPGIQPLVDALGYKPKDQPSAKPAKEPKESKPAKETAAKGEAPEPAVKPAPAKPAPPKAAASAPKAAAGAPAPKAAAPAAKAQAAKPAPAKSAKSEPAKAADAPKKKPVKKV
jgi:hypothetical protein